MGTIFFSILERTCTQAESRWNHFLKNATQKHIIMNTVLEYAEFCFKTNLGLFPLRFPNVVKK